MLLRPILLATALLAGLAPLTSTPPMKMGLWENTNVLKMSGASLPPGMPQQQTVKSRQCITPESWQKSFQSSRTSSCERKNESLTGGHYTADISCPNGNGHLDMTYSSTESGHGTVEMHLQSPHGAFDATSTMTMRFISSDCGAVTPEHPQILP